MAQPVQQNKTTPVVTGEDFTENAKQIFNVLSKYNTDNANTNIDTRKPLQRGVIKEALILLKDDLVSTFANGATIETSNYDAFINDILNSQETYKINEKDKKKTYELINAKITDIANSKNVIAIIDPIFKANNTVCLANLFKELLKDYYENNGGFFAVTFEQPQKGKSGGAIKRKLVKTMKKTAKKGKRTVKKNAKSRTQKKNATRVQSKMPRKTTKYAVNTIVLPAV
jgi:ribosomal protein L17